MRGQLVLCVSLFAFLQTVSGGNILFLSGIPSPSHHIYNRVLVVGLANQGHNVTFLSADIVAKQVLNVHYIHLEKVYESFYQGEESFNMLDMESPGTVASIVEFNDFAEVICEGVLASKGLDEILNYPKDFKFDAVVYDFTFGPCLLPLVTRFNDPPLISISAFANPPYTSDLIGGHKYPAFVPYYTLSYSTDMTFSQRFFNIFLYFVDWLSREFQMYPHFDKMTRRKFKFDYPSVKKIGQQTVLMLVNTDNAIDTPEPLQPNMIQVGGLQITEAKPLPEEMEKFIKSGKKGTVLMSLGTNVKSNMLGDDLLMNVLETFKQIPDFNFIWKFESDVKDLPAIPSKNVMVSKFLPQNDILAHSNVKAFVSHSGMLSTHEAFWHGKPIIGMPFFADQHSNIAKAINIGVGVKVDYLNLTVTSFKKSILTVLNDSNFWKNSQKTSKLFQDKPQKPLEVAVWWIEYAMRNPNLEHLKSPTLKLGPIASKSWDILLVLVLAFICIIYLIVKIVTLFLGGKKTNNSKRKSD